MIVQSERHTEARVPGEDHEDFKLLRIPFTPLPAYPNRCLLHCLTKKGNWERIGEGKVYSQHFSHTYYLAIKKGLQCKHDYLVKGLLPLFYRWGNFFLWWHRMSVAEPWIKHLSPDSLICALLDILPFKERNNLKIQKISKNCSFFPC